MGQSVSQWLIVSDLEIAIASPSFATLFETVWLSQKIQSQLTTSNQIFSRHKQLGWSRRILFIPLGVMPCECMASWTNTEIQSISNKFPTLWVLIMSSFMIFLDSQYFSRVHFANQICTIVWARLHEWQCSGWDSGRRPGWRSGPRIIWLVVCLVWFGRL